MSGTIPAVLKAPRFKVKYKYHCGDPKCRGHLNRILDWELTALQNRYHSDQETRDAVTKRFLNDMFAVHRSTGFYMGNFELAARRAKFSVLGVYWPPTKDTIPSPPTLF